MPVEVVCFYDLCFGEVCLFDFLREVDAGPQAWFEARADGDGDHVNSRDVGCPYYFFE